MIHDVLETSNDNSEPNDVFDDDLFPNDENDQSFMFDNELYNSTKLDVTHYRHSRSKSDFENL